jgi:hypothetical protein
MGEEDIRSDQWCERGSRWTMTAACAAGWERGSGRQGQPGFREDSQRERLRGITSNGGVSGKLLEGAKA